MKISLIQEPYTHIIDLVEEQGRIPECDDVVDAFLFVLSLHYPLAKVQEAANEWAP